MLGVPTRSLFVVAAGLSLAAGEARGVTATLVWEHYFAWGPNYYAPFLDAGDRTASRVLEYYDDAEQHHRVAPDGTDTIVSGNLPPLPATRWPPRTWLRHWSPNRHYLAQVDANVPIHSEGLGTPVPLTYILQSDGTHLGTLTNIGNALFLSNDGSTVAATWSRPALPIPDPTDEVAGLTFLDCAGQQLATLADVMGDFSEGALSPMGSLFAYERDDLSTTIRVTSRTAVTVADLPIGSESVYGMAWSPDETKLAVALKDLVAETPSHLDTLDLGGQLLRSVPLEGLRRIAFTADSAHVVAIGGDSALLLSVATGAVTLLAAPRAGFIACDVAASRAGGLLCVGTLLMPVYTGYHHDPLRPELEVVLKSSSSSSLTRITLPRDEASPSQPAWVGPSVAVADDGAFLLVETDHELRLYHLGDVGTP